MHQIIVELQKFITLKQESIAELFSLQTIQTELEYDLALLRLEFRYDEEADFLLFEAQLGTIANELSEVDGFIAQIITNIEFFSHQIAHL